VTDRPSILVTRPIFPDDLERIRAVYNVEYRDSQDMWRDRELERAVAEVDGLLCQLTDPISASIIDAGSRLRVISTISVGFDHIDVEAAERRAVIVTHTPGILTETTADFTFALLIAAARRVPEADRFVRAGRWRQWELDLLCGQEIHGRTLGIIGAGRIGRAVARRAMGFGMTVLYCSRRPLSAKVEADLFLERVELDHLLERSDFVSLHVPLVDETHHLIGLRELELMPDTAILINTARGPVVDEAALCDALERGSIGGAALDVFENEPHPDPRLLERDDVVLAPHLASASVTTRRRMSAMAVDDLLRVLSGQLPRHPVMM